VCVALPGQVVAIGERSPASIPGTVTITGSNRDVDLVMVPQVEIGDYVVVHSGYAIEVVPEQRALETLALLAEGGLGSAP
jgi:hydrogenase expression/formation protein HypC